MAMMKCIVHAAGTARRSRLTSVSRTAPSMFVPCFPKGGRRKLRPVTQSQVQTPAACYRLHEQNATLHFFYSGHSVQIEGSLEPTRMRCGCAELGYGAIILYLVAWRPRNLRRRQRRPGCPGESRATMSSAGGRPCCLDRWIGQALVLRQPQPSRCRTWKNMTRVFNFS